jgi:hypothetical protein
MPHSGWLRFVIIVFERAISGIGTSKTTGEQRISFMAAQPNQDSTLIWRKSSASGGDGACVEVAQSGSFMLVRDSRDQSGAVLKFTPGQWLGLVRRTKSNDAGRG